MALEFIKIEHFVEIMNTIPVLDVRSPGEYRHAHIPDAVSFPLFSDHERAEIGTLYKQRSKEDAIKKGLEYFGPKMKYMVEDAESILEKFMRSKKPEIEKPVFLIHCWRGGMRSSGLGWLLDLYGFKVVMLEGGYKSFRNWVLSTFQNTYVFRIIGGHTGSGKTEVIKLLRERRHQIIDLEGLANHKGSAFGNIGMPIQPTQEMFENKLAISLYLASRSGESIWIEDESQRIGDINIPGPLWNQISNSKVYFLQVPFEERLNHILEDYGQLDLEKLVNATMRIRKRLGGKDTKLVLGYLADQNIKEAFRILLTYYDRFYQKSLEMKAIPDTDIIRILCNEVSTEKNALRILKEEEMQDSRGKRLKV